MTILDDASNGSVLAVLLAATLIGGIAGAIRGSILLSRSARPGADAPSAAGDVMRGPWGSTHTSAERPWWTP